MEGADGSPRPRVPALQRRRPSPEPRSRGFRLPRPVLLGPVGEPPPQLVAAARFNGFPSRSVHCRLQNREMALLPEIASPRKRPRGARLLAGSAGLRAGVAAGFSRSNPPAASRQPPGSQKKLLMLAKSPQPLQPVTYLLFLYPLSCQHLRPPGPRSAQPRLVKCE